MSFTDHKITSFQHKIADLPDEPQIPAAELKARFDACPEELRQSLNAVCDDAARLEARVEGIVVDTFGDTIDKEMLSDELAAELDAKATQTALAAEAAAREDADDALQTAVSQKCEVYVGTYTGNDAKTRTIELGFRPKAVFVLERGFKLAHAQIGYDNVRGGMATEDWSGCGIKLLDNGFELNSSDTYNNNTHISNTYSNLANTKYVYLAFK